MSEALRLAELLECSMSRDISTERKAAAELRRLSVESEMRRRALQDEMQKNKCLTAELEALKNAISEAEPEAWRTFDGDGGYEYRDFDSNEDYAAEWAKRNPKHSGWVEALYTHPAQQAKPQPLSDERDARIAELDRQLAEARKDAERYRWLRKQHWSENLIGVVVRPKDQTKLGSMLPSLELLDDSIDHMKSNDNAMQKG